MPGLVGIVGLKGDPVNFGLMGAMRNVIRHRDWYKIDDYVNPEGTVAISRVHLGIINKDKQPYSARLGRVKIFLHGEIYNDEAAHCNALDYIYRLYEKRGPDFASTLNGSFIIVIVDESEHRVLIANDRIAAKPLFYFNDGQYIYFGPEMKSLLLTPTLTRRLNLAAVADFLTNGFLTREHTLMEGLETVDNATVLVVTPNGVSRHTYWEHYFKYGDRREGKEYSQRDYQETLFELLCQAVRRRLRTDNTYGILLSGGYDSRGILGCYLEAKGGQDLHTISWGREENIPHSDCAVARGIAQKLCADHRFYRLTAKEVVENFRDFVRLGEGLTWFPESYEVFHRIREQQGIDIVLRGDEWLGLQSSLVHDEHSMFRNMGIRTLRYIPSYQRILRPAYYQSFCEMDAETSRHISAQCTAQNIHQRKDFFYMKVELRNYLNPLNYVKNLALESFTPLLDYDLLDFVSTLPAQHRLNKTLYRKTVRTKFPELFQEMARRHNMIDWAASFKGSAQLRRFVYRELIEGPNLLSEFVDRDGLKGELDTFFSTPIDLDRKVTIEGTAAKLLERSPTIFGLAHKSVYSVRKWRGAIRDTLPPEEFFIRLLILKVWGDVFLGYPVVQTPEPYITHQFATSPVMPQSGNTA